MRKQRERGQYWVRYDDPDAWQVAQWLPEEDAWYVQGYDFLIENLRMLEIDETPVTRDTKTALKEGKYKPVEFRKYSMEDRCSKDLSVPEMVAKGINRFTDLMMDMIPQGDATREAILQLSYQVERIANTLEESKADQKQEGVTGPALDLAEQLVESWRAAPNRPPLTEIENLWYESQTKEEFLDKIATLMDIGEVVRVVEHTRYRDGGTIEYRDIHNRVYVVPGTIYNTPGIYSDTRQATWRESDRLKNIVLEVVPSF